jgi:dTDP-4-amino-4,6-dideoxygalactose transaminase
LAFIRQGAKIIFVDSRKDHPGIDEDLIEPLITSRTKAIIPVHYAGVACNMNKIMNLAEKYRLIVIEDAAQAINSYYNGQPLGSIGHLSTFSFHETKNIISGEGGLLVINDERFLKRSEIIWEKGTNRSEFFRGEVNKYGWVDIGSSFLPSELNSAYLWAQLENIEAIQKKRIKIWNRYYKGLKNWADKNEIELPLLPSYATNNGHMFYMICKSVGQRDSIIKRLKENEIHAVFHYQSLHNSKFYLDKHDGRELNESDRYTETLLRLPLFYELGKESQDMIIKILVS